MPPLRAGGRRAAGERTVRAPSASGVRRARARASARGSQGSGALCNGDMDGRAHAAATCRWSARRRGGAARRHASARDLSGRGHDRVLRVARTIADLDGRERVGAGARRGGARLSPRRLGAARAHERPEAALRVRRAACAAARCIADLAPRITGLLGRRAGRAPGLLALADERADRRGGGRGSRRRADACSRRFDASRASARALDDAAACRPSAATPGSYPPQLAELQTRRRSSSASGGPGRCVVLCGRAGGGDRRHPQAVALRPRVAYALGRGLGGGRRHGRERAGARHRRGRAPRLPGRRRAAGRRSSPAGPTGLSAPPPPPPRAASRARASCSPSCRPGTRAFRVELPRAQPDHGRASRG